MLSLRLIMHPCYTTHFSIKVFVNYVKVASKYAQMVKWEPEVHFVTLIFLYKNGLLHKKSCVY